jgi:hypothetical protein
MDAREVTRCVVAARVAAGLAFAAAPGRAGGLLIASDADTPGARLFIAAFGARDVLLGAGALPALASGRPARRWLAACVAADGFDAAATLQRFGELPRRRRALTFAVSALPAALGAALAWRLDA